MIADIVPFDENLHLYAVRECLIELQDFERNLEPRLPSGAQIDKEYVAEMRKRCTDCDGVILVAEVGDAVAGYATVLARVQSEGIDEGSHEYALISDLVVKESFRGKGIGRQLLQHAEDYAESKRARWLRIGVLAANQFARSMYESSGYSELHVELEKTLSNGQDRREK